MPDKELTEDQLMEKLNQKKAAEREKFLKGFEKLSKECGWTLKGVPGFTDDGRIVVQIVPVPLPKA